MLRRFIYFWDPTPNANVEHVAAGDVTQDEFEQVIERGFDDRRPSRSSPRRWMVRDYTDARRFLVVIFEIDEMAELSAWGITPVTAYPADKLAKQG